MLHVSVYTNTYIHKCTGTDNNVCELIAVKVLHTSLLNTTVVAFKVLPLGSYALIPAPSPLFETILGTGFVEWPSEQGRIKLFGAPRQ